MLLRSRVGTADWPRVVLTEDWGRGLTLPCCWRVRLHLEGVDQVTSMGSRLVGGAHRRMLRGWRGQGEIACRIQIEKLPTF